MVKRFIRFALRVREEFILPKSVFTSIMDEVSELFILLNEHLWSVSRRELLLQSACISCNCTTYVDSLQSDVSILSDVWESLNSDAQFLRACKVNFMLFIRSYSTL